MVEDIIQEIEKLINKELEKATKEHGQFNSHHEGCSVLREELEETIDELIEATNYYDGLWDHVKSNMTPQALEFVKVIKERLVKTIKEAIQAAAMCDKYVLSLQDNGTGGLND